MTGRLQIPKLFFFLLKSQSIPHFTSPPSCSPHLPECSCTSCWRGAGKCLCGRECQNVLVELLYRTETHLKLTSVSLDASRKSHSSQVIVPEDFPTIPPCKRFPRLLVTMMLRMFSKIFFSYNCSVSIFPLNLHSLNISVILDLGSCKATEAASPHCTKHPEKVRNLLTPKLRRSSNMGLDLTHGPHLCVRLKSTVSWGNIYGNFAEPSLPVCSFPATSNGTIWNKIIKAMEMEG